MALNKQWKFFLYQKDKEKPYSTQMFPVLAKNDR